MLYNMLFRHLIMRILLMIIATILSINYINASSQDMDLSSSSYYMTDSLDGLSDSSHEYFLYPQRLGSKPATPPHHMDYTTRLYDRSAPKHLDSYQSEIFFKLPNVGRIVGLLLGTETEFSQLKTELKTNPTVLASLKTIIGHNATSLTSDKLADWSKVITKLKDFMVFSKVLLLLRDTDDDQCTRLLIQHIAVTKENLERPEFQDIQYTRTRSLYKKYIAFMKMQLALFSDAYYKQLESKIPEEVFCALTQCRLASMKQFYIEHEDAIEQFK